MPEKYIGVCLDGSKATMVTTVDAVASTYLSVDSGDPVESLKLLLKNVKQKKKSPPVRVTVSAQTTILKSMDVTARDLQTYEDFQNLLYATLPVARDSTSITGLVHNPEDLLGDAVCSGSCASLPSSVVSQVYQAMGAVRCEVVSTPLILSAYDGVWLGIQKSMTSVSLVTKGRIVAYRQLRLGGLESIVSLLLGSSAEVKPVQDRVELALITANSTDTQAATEIGRYMRMLTSELSQTIEFWRRQGEMIENEGMVLVYGPGANSLALDGALHESGFVRGICSSIDRLLVNLKPSTRLDSYAAFLAAVTTGKNMPYISHINPDTAQLRVKKLKKLKVTGITLSALTLLSALGLLVVKPVIQAKSSESSAKNALALAQGKFAAVQDIYVLSQESEQRDAVNKEVTGSQPQWVYIYTELGLSTPVSANVSQMVATSTQDAVSVSISASFPQGRYEDMSAWLKRLREIKGVTSAWTRGFNEREGKVTADITVTFDAALVLEEVSK